MKTWHRFDTRLIIFVISCAALNSGCMPHLLSSGEKAPAQLLAYPGAPPIHDGRVRFRQIVCELAGQHPPEPGTHIDCTHLLWRLADEKEPASAPPPLPSHDPHLHLLIVPGAFAECFPEFGMPFEDVDSTLRKRGYRIDFIPVSGRSGADHNADQIAAALDQIPDNPADRIVLIGHSKGVVDILHFLVNYPQLARRIRAMVSVSGPVNGSPLADEFAGIYRKIFSRMPLKYCGPGDRNVLHSLTRSYCMTWLASHRLPQHVKYFSLGSFTRREDINPLMLFTYDLLATVEPRNDGYVAFCDQVIPGATLLGYADLDHFDIALPIRERMNFGGYYSRAGARRLLLEAIVLTVAEALNSPY